MTDTERAIAKMYYRLVYELKLKTIAEVPPEYRSILAQYRREVESCTATTKIAVISLPKRSSADKIANENETLTV